MKELTMKLSGFIAISCVCLFWGGELAKAEQFSINAYARSPLSVVCTSMDSLEPAPIISLSGTILNVLGPGGGAKVAPSVVQRIPVSMVDFGLSGDAQYLAMHSNRPSFVDCSDSIKRERVFGPYRAPFEAHQVCKVVFVNRCELAARERDTVFWFRLKVQRNLVHRSAPRKARLTSASILLGIGGDFNV